MKRRELLGCKSTHGVVPNDRLPICRFRRVLSDVSFIVLAIVPTGVIFPNLIWVHFDQAPPSL